MHSADRHTYLHPSFFFFFLQFLALGRGGVETRVGRQRSVEGIEFLAETSSFCAFL
jgi:hypothetical protein